MNPLDPYDDDDTITQMLELLDNGVGLIVDPACVPSLIRALQRVTQPTTDFYGETDDVPGPELSDCSPDLDLTDTVRTAPYTPRELSMVAFGCGACHEDLVNVTIPLTPAQNDTFFVQSMVLGCPFCALVIAVHDNPDQVRALLRAAIAELAGDERLIPDDLTIEQLYAAARLRIEEDMTPREQDEAGSSDATQNVQVCTEVALHPGTFRELEEVARNRSWFNVPVVSAPLLRASIIGAAGFDIFNYEPTQVTAYQIAVAAKFLQLAGATVPNTVVRH